MAALVVKDEKAHQFRLSSHKHRVDDQKLGIWHRYSEVGQTCIKHVANSAALKFASTNPDAAISFQSNRRGGFHTADTQATIHKRCGTTRRKQAPETHNVNFPQSLPIRFLAEQKDVVNCCSFATETN